MEFKKDTKITISRKNGIISVSNSDSLLLEVGKLTASSVLVAMIHQTLLTRFEFWDDCDNDVEIGLTIHEVIK